MSLGTGRCASALFPARRPSCHLSPAAHGGRSTEHAVGKGNVSTEQVGSLMALKHKRAEVLFVSKTSEPPPRPLPIRLRMLWPYTSALGQNESLEFNDHRAIGGLVGIIADQGPSCNLTIEDVENDMGLAVSTFIVSPSSRTSKP